jgi:hypothetical protein
MEVLGILGSSENMIWKNKPRFWSYLAHSVYASLIMPLVFSPFLFFLFLFVFVKSGVSPFNFCLACEGVSLLGFTSIFMLMYPYTEYVITNKRIILQSGFIAINLKSVEFDKIVSLDVRVDLLDKALMQNTGTIIIYVPNTTEMDMDNQRKVTQNSHILSCIEDPYAVLQMLKDVAFNVKTDISFPNAMRPKANPGYQAKYKPEGNS